MSDKQPIAQVLKLKDAHPTMIKLNKLYDLAEELGIRISFGTRETLVHDLERDNKLPPLLLQDLDNGESIQDWPPCFEYKAVYRNPAWLAKETAENEERTKARVADFAKQESERQAKEQAIADAQAREQELKERAELARLKNKYGE